MRKRKHGPRGGSGPDCGRARPVAAIGVERAEHGVNTDTNSAIPVTQYLIGGDGAAALFLPGDRSFMLHCFLSEREPVVWPSSDLDDLAILFNGGSSKGRSWGFQALQTVAAARKLTPALFYDEAR